MPRPYLRGLKQKERDDFVSVMNMHVVSMENSIDKASDKGALYQTEKDDLSTTIKRIKELLSRI